MANGGKVWTSQDREQLLAMRRAKKTWVAIGEHFGISANAARLQLRFINLGAKHPALAANIRWLEDENRELLSRVDGGEDIAEVAVSLMRTRWACVVQYNALKRGARPIAPKPDVFKTEPSLRNRAQHQTITAALFGDPLPGRSALDHKRINS